MVLQIARPTRLDTLVNIIKQNSQQNNNQDNSQSEKNWIVVDYDTRGFVIEILLSMETFTRIRKIRKNLYIYILYIHSQLEYSHSQRMVENIFIRIIVLIGDNCFFFCNIIFYTCIFWLYIYRFYSQLFDGQYHARSVMYFYCCIHLDFCKKK